MRAVVRALLAALVVALAACSAPAQAPPAAVPQQGKFAVGVYEPLSPGSTWQVSQFTAAAGEWPSLDVYYSKWGQPFATGFAQNMAAHGGTVLVQVDPVGISLAAVAGGSQDAYLKAYAAAVRRFGRQVVVSFAQEMNGPWYPWGTGHVSPTVYIAAWRHLVAVFRDAGALNVTWLWDVNCAFPGSSPVSDWWPGSAYVTWAGVDCYYSKPADTFSSLFGPVLADVRRVTGKPLLIAETAAGPDSGQQRDAQIRGLFAGARADGLRGVVWFDETQDNGPYHQNWRLEDDPGAMAAFRLAVKRSG